MKLKPEFFDIFGIATFLYITVFSSWMLLHHIGPRWPVIILLGIGIGGFIIDAIIVYRVYLK